MLQTCSKKIMLPGLLALLCLLAACGTSGVAGSSPSQTLQNSATAMSKLNSVHVDLQSTVNIQSSGTTANTNSGGITFNVTGTADAATPNQVALHLSLGPNPMLAVVSTGQAVYVQHGTGQWYSVDSSKFANGSQKYMSQGLPASLSQILLILQNAKLVDKGVETVGNQKLDHIQATLDSQSLQQLSTQINSMLPANQQSAQNQLKQGTMDLWIDPTTSYLSQAKLDAIAQVDLDSVSSMTAQTTKSGTLVPVEVKAQLNFSKFNQPVNIQAPANAVPLP